MAFRASVVTVWIQYSLFLVSSWECLEIGMSLSIGWITFRLDTLVCVFHSMSLACFLPRAFVSLLAWHTPFTLLSLTRCFQICSWSSFYTVHLSQAQYLILWWTLDLIFNSMLIFSLQKGERHVFTFTPFSRESPWSPCHLYLMELELKVDSRICGYRWGIDLVIVCFSHLFYLGLLMGIL